MKTRSSAYPLGQYILGLLEKSNQSITDFVRGLGYRNTNKGIREIDWVLENGSISIGLSDRLKASALDQREFEEVLNQNLGVLQAEGEQIADEEEQRERAEFQPYLLPEVENEIGSPLTIWAITGGNRRNELLFPKDFISQPRASQFEQIKSAIKDHFAQNGGRTLFQGRITAYRFFADYDADPLFFSVEGDYIGEEFDGEPPAQPKLVIGKKNFSGGFY